MAQSAKSDVVTASEIVRRFVTLGRLSAYFCLMISIGLVAGLIGGVSTLTTGGLLILAIKPTGATATICSAIALLRLYRAERHGMEPDRETTLLALVPIVIGGATLIEYLFKVNLGIDTLIPLHNPSGPFPGRIASNSAFGLFALGLALLELSISSERRSIGRAQFWASLIGFIGLLALIGYAYNIQSFYSFTNMKAMSFIAAANFFLFSIGLLFLHPAEGATSFLTNTSTGGITVRRLIPAVLILPIIGSVVFYGVTSHAYDDGFGLSLVVVLSMMLFTVLIGGTSVTLSRVDELRKEVEQKLEESREELRELSTHVQSMQEEERLRIAREIHDELGQSLTGLKMEVALLKPKMNTTTDASKEVTTRIESIMMLVDHTIKSVQRIATELRPGILDDLGLAAAIEWQSQEFERRSGITCLTHLVSDHLDLDQERSTALFRIFQEALTNVGRHSNATKVLVWLSQDSSNVKLSIRDNGVGMPTDPLKSKSLGLRGMRERALLWNGSFDIEAKRGRGTAVTVTIPKPGIEESFLHEEHEEEHSEIETTEG